ncbi:hypothetical protein HXX76_002208 [Chlamydomonas incerta]|uniref:Protein kinase domain-containing protein n=1 Tax=Chlamydomonas incerta TaxID=51695 RepID=A0A835WAP9_CHLIN|nr:hypothetical protein HXX76_002208 [Chlamydomonas incerta]|eukprot:KAG2443865.1 hypothetical protein HXX76_002208 [Chlamydomonas incerta]
MADLFEKTASTWRQLASAFQADLEKRVAGDLAGQTTLANLDLRRVSGAGDPSNPQRKQPQPQQHQRQHPQQQQQQQQQGQQPGKAGPGCGAAAGGAGARRGHGQAAGPQRRPESAHAKALCRRCAMAAAGEAGTPAAIAAAAAAPPAPERSPSAGSAGSSNDNCGGGGDLKPQPSGPSPDCVLSPVSPSSSPSRRDSLSTPAVSDDGSGGGGVAAATGAAPKAAAAAVVVAAAEAVAAAPQAPISGPPRPPALQAPQAPQPQQAPKPQPQPQSQQPQAPLLRRPATLRLRCIVRDPLTASMLATATGHVDDPAVPLRRTRGAGAAASPPRSATGSSSGSAAAPPPHAAAEPPGSLLLIEEAVLGRGAFGFVTLVSDAVTDQPYALKRLRRSDVSVRHVMQEQEAVRSLMLDVEQSSSDEEEGGSDDNEGADGEGEGEEEDGERWCACCGAALEASEPAGVEGAATPAAGAPSCAATASGAGGGGRCGGPSGSGACSGSRGSSTVHVHASASTSSYNGTSEPGTAPSAIPAAAPPITRVYSGRCAAAAAAAAAGAPPPACACRFCAAEAAALATSPAGGVRRVGLAAATAPGATAATTSGATMGAARAAWMAKQRAMGWLAEGPAAAAGAAAAQTSLQRVGSVPRDAHGRQQQQQQQTQQQRQQQQEQPQACKRERRPHNCLSRQSKKGRGTAFCVRQLGTFQDDHYLYLLLEYCPGGDLDRLARAHTRKTLVPRSTWIAQVVAGPAIVWRGLPEAAVRFYAAGLVIALQELHARHVVYRDLKPGNVLLDGGGYPRLADFGMAKPLGGPGGRATSACGTLDFMAPEVVKIECEALAREGRGVVAGGLLDNCRRLAAEDDKLNNNKNNNRNNDGGGGGAGGGGGGGGRRTRRDGPMGSYGLEVDWWSLGAVLYVLLTGTKPFCSPEAEAAGEDAAKLLMRIIDPWYEPPLPVYLSPAARDLVRKLLTRQPRWRLGCGGGGAEEVRQHTFFKGFDWPAYEERRLAPPFPPQEVTLPQHQEAESVARFFGFYGSSIAFSSMPDSLPKLRNQHQRPNGGNGGNGGGNGGGAGAAGAAAAPAAGAAAAGGQQQQLQPPVDPAVEAARAAAAAARRRLQQVADMLRDF